MNVVFLGVKEGYLEEPQERMVFRGEARAISFLDVECGGFVVVSCYSRETRSSNQETEQGERRKRGMNVDGMKVMIIQKGRETIVLNRREVKRDQVNEIYKRAENKKHV